MPGRSRQRIQRLGPMMAEVVKLREEGYALVREHRYVYMCLVCEQVWPLKHLAEACDAREHASSATQEYHRPTAAAGNRLISHTYTPLTPD